MASHAVRHRIAFSVAWLGAGVVIAGCGEVDPISPPTDPSAWISAARPPQQLAVPVYLPSASEDWNDVWDAMPTARFIVINANSGPGSKPEPHLTSALANTHGKGARAVGYVHTEWANSRTNTRTIPAIKTEIDTWFSFYPGLDGIFVDEVTGGADCTSAREYYRHIYDHVKRHRSTATVILNPGRAVDPCYRDVADIIVTFEGSFADYQRGWSNADRGWETPDNAHRIWHIIHSTGRAEWRSALDLSRARNAGYVYATHLRADTATNTFGALPPYFRDEVANVGDDRGGNDIDPTALSRWSASNDGANVYYRVHFSQPFSLYRVYIDSDHSTATGYRVAGIGADYMVVNGRVFAHHPPGWGWTAIGSSGQTSTANSVSWAVPRGLIGESSFPNGAFLSFEAKTKGSPVQNAGRYAHVYTSTSGRITNYFAENDANNVYYHATFSAPFTFQHVFIDTDGRSGTGYAYGQIGADFMIENSNLYRSTGPGWSWTLIGSVAGTGGSTGARSWTVPRSVLGETAASDELASVVFHGSGGSREFATRVYSHVYTR